MNLGEMCRMAARYSDRADEFEKTAQEDGGSRYEGESLMWFEIFRDAINEAYFDVSRSYLSPSEAAECAVPDDQVLDLTELTPLLCSVCGVFRLDGVSAVEYVFRDRMHIEVLGVQPGEEVVVRYHYLPDRLEKENDEPVFPESMVDPMVYVTLAVARVWQSERKTAAAQAWNAEYYHRLRTLRSSTKPMQRRRLPRGWFR